MLLTLIAAVIAFAWLVPNHYPPWTAAWSDALALTGLCLLAFWIAICTKGRARISWPLLTVAGLAGAVILGQALSGRIVYFGDALVAGFYLAIWVLAVLVGHRIAASPNAEKLIEAVLAAWLFAALASVGIGLLQWLGGVEKSIYFAELAPNHSPWANVAQRTHFSTICFLGLCALGWLYQRMRIGRVVLFLGAVFLLLGMAMSTARTAWVQMAWICAWLLILGRQRSGRISRLQIAALGLIFIGLLVAWPSIADVLLLSTGRDLEMQLSQGFRLRHWAMMLDAIGREPWWGYGWQQVGMVQQLVALDFPAIGEQIDSSHNLVLDLLLWNGIPIGLTIAFLLVFWFFSHLRRCVDGQKAWLLAAIGGLLAHAMFEFPFEYAYFLIPMGLLMGAVDVAPMARRGVDVTRPVMLAATALATALLIGIGRDYVRAEENHRVLRLESARIGVDRLVTPAAKLDLLTQLQAYLSVARIDPKPGMAPEQLEQIRQVSMRFGQVATQFEYALAAGLNGQAVAAQQTLDRLCRIHPVEQCSLALARWRSLAQSSYPQLASIPLPTLP